MIKDTAAAKEYFGYCIAPNKNPTPIFEQLLLGIHGYIAKHIAPWEINYLTPTKLAQFYRLVGGNFDRLFLESPSPSLSFVYSSLGCQHTLHQDKNLFEPPTIPALTAQGFIRWQVIQILLSPAENVPYIQEAVKRFEILNSGPGGPFPKLLPTECLPTVPDLEMVQWHEGVGRRLRNECEPRSRPTSARADIASVVSENEFNPLKPRRRPPHLHHSSQSPTPRRQSSSEAREGRPLNSPHPLRNSKHYKRATVESESSTSSSSESPPPRTKPKVKTPDRSPRSYSVARNPYSPPPDSIYRNKMGRRHSSHGLEPQLIPKIRDSLSPQFYAQNGGRTRPGNGPSPIHTGIPHPSKSATIPIPNSQSRAHRSTLSHDRSKDASWKDKLTAYVGLTAEPGRRRNDSETREIDRDLEKDRRSMDGTRFVEGVGGIPLDRRRASPGRMDWDTDYESQKRSRRGRRPFGEDLGHDRYHDKA